MAINTFGYDAEQGVYLSDTSQADNYHWWILEHLKNHFGKRVVEVGGGTGSMTKYLLPFVESLMIIEPSHHLFPVLSQSVHKIDELNRVHEIMQGELSDLEPEIAQFKPDTFVYINVLEHIQDDQAELNLAYNLLPNNGRVITFSPAMPWLYSKRDERVGHYRRYTKFDLVSKMRRAGFIIEQAYYFDLIGALLWFIKFQLLRSDKISKGKVGLYDRLFVPISKNVEPSWIPFGKNLVVIGLKNA